MIYILQKTLKKWFTRTRTSLLRLLAITRNGKTSHTSPRTQQYVVAAATAFLQTVNEWISSLMRNERLKLRKVGKRSPLRRFRAACHLGECEYEESVLLLLFLFVCFCLFVCLFVCCCCLFCFGVVFFVVCFALFSPTRYHTGGSVTLST